MNNKSYPQRKSPRFKDYDYSQDGAYFVIVCAHLRQCHFGTIEADTMQFTALGEVAERELQLVPQRWSTVDVDLFVVMPNHVHVIVLLWGHGDSISKQRTLGHVMGSYKAGVTRLARLQGLIDEGYPLWQERFHDHIIRSEYELNRIQEYVLHNPALWAEDQLRT